MLQRENLLSFIKIHLKAQEIWGNFPITWSHTAQKLTIVSNRGEVRYNAFRAVLISLYTAILWIQLINEGSSVPIVTSLERTLFATAASVMCFGKWVVYLRRNEFKELLNLFLKFEKRHDKDASISTRGFDVLLMKFSLLCGIGFGPMVAMPYALLRLLMPCNSATFLYAFIPDCRMNGGQNNDIWGWHWSSLIMLGFICIFTFWIAIDGAGGLASVSVNFSWVEAYCLRRYLDHVKNLIISKPEKATKHLPYYRQIQLLSSYYNRNHGDGVVLLVILLDVVGIIISFYGIISLGSQISVPELLLFLTVAQDGILVIIMYTSALAQLYCASKDMGGGKIKEKLLGVLSPFQLLTTRKKKWEIRYLNSFRPIRAILYDGSFVHEQTPLIMLNFCINQTVNLLVLN